MRLIIDCETNALINPTQVWVVVTKDVVTGVLNVYRQPTSDILEAQALLQHLRQADLIIGHNVLGYDLPVLANLLNIKIDVSKVLDTFIISKLVDYPREHHSVEDYGTEFGLEKISWHDYSKYSLELEEYCIRDVNITEKIYRKYLRYINNPAHQDSIRRQHKFNIIVSNLSDKGFTLDTVKVQSLLGKVTKVLNQLDIDIQEAFPPRLKLIREITPKETKFGTISLTSIPKVMREDISDLSVGSSYSYCEWIAFNPASNKQIIDVLNQAGWKPVEKTKGHIEAERQLNRLKRVRQRTPEVDLEIQTCHTLLDKLSEHGWKCNEHNLSTLPRSAPAPARTLANRILHEARRRTLQEWLNLVQPDGRVHGNFQACGAWTHRMAHQKPNMANITNEYDTNDNKRLLGKELRQCWTVPKDRLLVGVDAEGIQLRIFAHYVNDAELIDSLVRGKKSDKTDPHSLNQRVLGDVCRSRQAAKRYLYAMFLGAGVGKLREILDCSERAAQEAQGRLLERYPGFAKLKSEIIPADAKRGWFTGLDGRRVRIPGDTEGTRRHLAMSGYLQNGEIVIIQEAAIQADPLIREHGSYFVNIVHDEFQIETPNDFQIAKRVADIVDDCIRSTSSTFNLHCPMAGSYWNDTHKEYTIGRTWYSTH